MKETGNAVKYLAKGLATGAIVYFMPQIAQATGHGILTLIFGVLTILLVWDG